MAEYQKVKSTMEISMAITDFLELFSRRRINGGERSKAVREINDILQGRSERTVDELLEEVREKSHNCYPGAVDGFRRDIMAVQAQKALLSVPYDRIGNEQYEYKTHLEDGCPPLKIIDQELFDRVALVDGFPPDFFKGALFERVTVYCMPDNADCTGSSFRNCFFATCRIKGGQFADCSIYDSEFHSCLLEDTAFLHSTLAHTFFMDDIFKKARFDHSRLKFCIFRDAKMEAVSFRNADLDGSSFSRINARNIRGLRTAAITCGGATEEEVRQIRKDTFRALGIPEKKRLTRDSGRGR